MLLRIPSEYAGLGDKADMVQKNQFFKKLTWWCYVIANNLNSKTFTDRSLKKKDLEFDEDFSQEVRWS